MKKTVAAVALVIICSSVSFAASIVASKHNLSTTGTGVHSTTQTMICIFCHAPHNPVSSVPLWNRAVTSLDSYILVDMDSPTLTPATKDAKLGLYSISSLCINCHVGTLEEIGSNTLNKQGNPFSMVDPNDTWTKSGVGRNGSRLSNHPIAFDYALAQSQKPDRLRPVAEVKAALGSVFYRSTATGIAYNDSLECASCHVVHDPANTPFLRTSNANNALCLACHIR